MARKKDIKIILDTYGNYLGMEKGCIILRDKKRNETRYPLIARAEKQKIPIIKYKKNFYIKKR